MKKIVLAAAATMALSTAAYAAGPVAIVAPTAEVLPQASGDGFSVIGRADWMHSTNTLQGRVGVAYDYSDLTVHSMLVGSYTASTFTFDGVEIGAMYHLSSSVNLYGTVSMDRGLSYTDTTLGVAFRF